MAKNITAAPIVVTPSQNWDGNDGPWSTFNIHVGTPPQPARVLVSTALGETWVISANTTQGGCINGAPSTCKQTRGLLVNVNSSTTWQDQGLYNVGVETNLPDYDGQYDVADYGLETVGLGLPGENGVSEPNLIVGALATTDFYLGYLGVTNQPTNFTQFDDPHTSFLSTLHNQSKIPSLSYSYSAGAQYRLKKVDGTLTLGGYDASRFIPNSVDFQFADDISRDLVVGLQSITFSDSQTKAQPLLNEGILTFIDATVPHIWLPQDACTLFEDAFGITYNETVQRYLVNDTTHEKLQSQNASVSFTLGNNINGGATVDITLPYAAFDLELSYPIVNGTQNYFPLRRAANETQYTLGRTFLQEAYLTVDYERTNFSVSQCSWVDNAPEHIVAIRSINDTSATPSTNSSSKSSSISIGAIVGIIVGIVVLLLLLAAAAAFFIIRKRRRRRKEAEKKKEEEEDPFRKPEMDGSGKPPVGELYAEGKLDEMDSSSKVEMQGSEPGADKKHLAEIEGTRGGAEMEGTQGGMEMEGSHLRAEMAGDHLAPVELDAGPQGLYELSSPNTSNSELPSPLSPSTERRSGLSASWSRRQKPIPKVPDAENSDVSTDAETPGRRSGASIWPGRRSWRTSRNLSPNDISSPSSDQRNRRRDPTSPSSDHRRPRGSDIPLETTPSRSNTPVGVSSPSSSSRERRRKGNSSPRNIHTASNRASPSPLRVSHPSDSELPRTDSPDDFGRRNGDGYTHSNPASPEMWSPVSPSDRSLSHDSREMVDRRRPSPLRSGGSGSGTGGTQSPPPGNFF